ncbi:NAD(P)/FAD-dependent oxidoreductase [Pseudooceanicola nanhaiensis]|uniref:NAD(P)/FAD-dependent oxidoreductase n=1 Tax=Pseudooceanicola nanhaiensis TaxID=375761 RepID=UPI001CD44914|nr:FAD-binding oxidoreductase [Pseudooceanicola nanhaiensis]MCA0920824.1 FAD-binding oxidoreductase [Pseudooceanicola nanhaiensis]
MKMHPYWLDSRPAFRGATPGDLPEKADVVVVGGGFCGLSTALAVAKRGGSVLLLEAGAVGEAASGRNGGQCNNGFAHDYGSVRAEIGAARAEALYRAYDDAVDTVERIVREEAIDCAFERRGKLKLAGSAAAFEKFRASAELLQCEADPECFLVEKADLGSEIGSDVFHGGLVYPKSAQVHVGRLAVGLAEAAVRHGADIREDAPVTGLTRLEGDRYRVTTPRGSVEAGQVVLATGTSQQGPLFHFRRRIVPIGSFVLATEPLSEALCARILPQRRSTTVARTIGNYFRFSPDNRLIFGGRARFAISNPTQDRKSGAVLHRQMLEYFPYLADTRIDYCWGGVIDATRDRHPRAGQHRGLYYAMGFSGHGVQMATHMGGVLARMLEGDSAANPFAAMDWPAIPGHFGPPWFLPLVGAYYTVKDRFAA